jgi:hypothetical protein
MGPRPEGLVEDLILEGGYGRLSLEAANDLSSGEEGPEMILSDLGRASGDVVDGIQVGETEAARSCCDGMERLDSVMSIGGRAASPAPAPASGPAAPQFRGVSLVSNL